MSEPIRTGRLMLRSWLESDRARFAHMNGDPRVMEHFPALLSLAESDATVDRLQAHIAEHGWGLWAVEIPSVTDFAGFIGLARPRFTAAFTPCVEIGWRLDAPYWGQGYATEGARAALEYGFRQLRLPEIVAFTTPGNLRSIRVMEKAGLTRDTAGDFDHPLVPDGHRLRQHVLYRKIAAHD